MKACLVNYNFTPSWLLEYPEIDYVIYDRSDSEHYLKDFPPEKVVKTRNIGNVDNDRLGYLIDNYHDLPDVFLWSKSNLFKYISQKEFDHLKERREFTPLLTQNHRQYSDKNGIVCFYAGGMYHERNDSWYLGEVPAKHFGSWPEWAKMFGLPNPPYIPFTPGGNYILTRETVHKHSRRLYQRMKNTLTYTQLPGEAQLCERSYYLLWS